MADFHLMLFDLYAGGHHGHHLEEMARYWAAHRLPGRLSIVVPPVMLEKHARLREVAAETEAAGVRLVVIDEPLQLKTTGGVGFRDLLRNDREHGRLLRRYVERLRPDHCLLMFFDHTQVSLATSLRFDFPVRFSGIYFRPTFHYPALSGRTPSWKERVLAWRKKLILGRAVRNPHFDALFCFDPFVVPDAQALHAGFTALALPDGIERTPPVRTPAAMRAHLGVEAGRQVFLLFGVLDRRKGVLATLEALGRLPAAVQARVCLVLAGRTGADDRAAIHAEVARLQAETPAQVLLHDTFIPDADIQDLFRAADVALVPYVRHIGSSGVLIRAAAEQVPILGSDFGVIGAHIRQRHLGLAVDTTDADALAAGLRQFVENPQIATFDPEAARQFANENTLTAFMETLFRQMHPEIGSR